MAGADFSSPRSTRFGVALAVVALHVAFVVALVRGFAPDFTAHVADRVFGAFLVTVTASPPKPPPATKVEPRADGREGEAAQAGRLAEPRKIDAPSPHIILATQAAQPIVGQGADNDVGTRDTGMGTAGGGQGNGTGSGSFGQGQGGGGAGKVAKISGDINSARDYPSATREQRLGDYVIVALTVGSDGRVKACRVHRASKDPQADQITCRLASERFRFRPATDFAGNPIESIFGWQQRWFDPRQKN